MKCSHLSGGSVQSCSAIKGSYVPSAFEVAEYCKSGRHRVCPFYCRHNRKSRGDFMARDLPNQGRILKPMEGALRGIMPELRDTRIDGRSWPGYLAETIILQALEDIWCDDVKWESWEFFTGEGFVDCADIIGLSLDERQQILLLAKGAFNSSMSSLRGRSLLAQQDGLSSDS